MRLFISSNELVTLLIPILRGSEIPIFRLMFCLCFFFFFFFCYFCIKMCAAVCKAILTLKIPNFFLKLSDKILFLFFF